MQKSGRYLTPRVQEMLYGMRRVRLMLDTAGLPPVRASVGRNFRALHNLPAARERIALWHYARWTSLPLFDRCGSVHGARVKQQGRRLPLFIFEILTSTRRLRGLLVAFTQRTHPQRAIGVMSFQRSRIF